MWKGICKFQHRLNNDVLYFISKIEKDVNVGGKRVSEKNKEDLEM